MTPVTPVSPQVTVNEDRIRQANTQANKILKNA